MLLRLIAFLLLTTPFPPQQSGPGARLPIPDADAITAAETLLKNLFKEAYAKGDQGEFAAQLAQRARQIKNVEAFAERYVSFMEAQRLFAISGDLGKCLSVIDECARLYAVDILALKSAPIEALSKVAKTPAEFRQVAKGRMILADIQVQRDLYEDAEKNTQAAVVAARKTTTTSLIARATAKGKEVADLKSQYEKTKKSGEALASSPDDAAANQVIGRFQCLIKGNWGKGLPFLAKGTDAALKGTAAKDLSSPEVLGDQLALGDEWWAHADKSPLPAKEHLRRRAVTWYEFALPKLASLDKSKVNGRVLDFFQQHRLKGTWVELMEPKLYGLPAGKPGAPIQVPAFQRLTLASFPKGDFDALSIRFRPIMLGNLGLFVEYQNRKRGVSLGHGMGILSTDRLVGTMWTKDATANFERLPEHTLTIVVEEDESIIYLDGREMLRAPSILDRLDYLGIAPAAGDVFLDMIKLRRKE